MKVIAADWLRLLLQMGEIAQPESVFETLVAATIQAFKEDTPEKAH
jgi:hypothetical protein